ncbi:isoprenylcysteine carboxylmethyltransferase family protein [Cellvibrio sp. UBA7661]|uniref:methyltransferase family protein n=1 Tax=Cellvibrio sp. UBA7661 TaxID=1946311 RepID=UPI002F35A9C4
MRMRAPPILVVFLIAVVMYLVEPISPVLDIDHPANLIASIVAFLSGVIFCLLGVYEFRRVHTTVDPLNIEKATTLVTSGVFGVSRNPMYVGFAFILFSFVLYLKSPLLVIGVCFFVVYITKFQILPEEQAMLTKFGNQYQQYMLKVRRWL